MLDSKDLEFLDAIPLLEEEQHGRTGPNKNQRQPAHKTLCDLKFLMLYITDKVVAAGRLADVITRQEIHRRNGTQLHRRSEEDPKMVAMGKMLF